MIWKYLGIYYSLSLVYALFRNRNHPDFQGYWSLCLIICCWSEPFEALYDMWITIKAWKLLYYLNKKYNLRLKLTFPWRSLLENLTDYERS